MAATAAMALFEALDKDGDGKVSASELRGGCALAALDEEEAAAVLALADADGDGLLDRDEFLGLAAAAAATDQQQQADDDDGCRQRCLRVAFGMFADGGATLTVAGEQAEQEEEERRCITPASLQRMLRRLMVANCSKQQQQLKLDLDECRAMICRFDLDGDGVISFQEFRIMMHDGLLL